MASTSPKGGSRAPAAFFGRKTAEETPPEAPKSSVISELEEDEPEEELEEEPEEEETPENNVAVLIKDGVIVTEAKTTPLIEVDVKPARAPTPSFHTVNPDVTSTPKVKAIIPRKTKLNLRVAGWNLVLEEGKRVEVPVVCLDHLRRHHFI